MATEKETIAAFEKIEAEVPGFIAASLVDLLRLKADAILVATGIVGRLDLSSIAASEASEPVFAGFAPFPAMAKPPPAAKALDEDRLIRAELGPLLRQELALAPRRIPVVLASLRLAAAAKRRHNVAESIKRILLAS